MKKYEKDLLIGTFITLVGIYLLVVIGLHWFISWSIMAFGKLIVIFSAMEYVDYCREYRGEDLSNDNQIKKMIRKLRRKRY